MMGMKTLPLIVSRLLEVGRPARRLPPCGGARGRPANDHRHAAGHCRENRTGAARTPTVIVVGAVVKLREQLNWFEKRPLFGKRIVLTRAPEQAKEFGRLLAAFGAEPIEAPTINIVPPASWEALDRAIARLRSMPG